ncbi:MAG TPA: GTPase ObgE [bacterium]|nr:GTPase ObgE [bacterium]
MIIDEVSLTLEAGAGGNGCLSFRREKFIPRGGPDGGDGGRGGSIYLEARLDCHTLVDFTFRPLFTAHHGQHGKGKNMHGKDAEDVVVPVPVGTMVLSEKGELIVDMDAAGKKFLIARGGRGGRGNTTFTSSVHQAPRLAEKGEPGEKKIVRLELKMLADVGLVGFPNAGKSTLLSRVSKARPKIADYPFTTLEPHLGVVQLSENRSFVLADVPGLIEDASEGKGLGIKFLKHLERTQLLLHLVELSQMEDFAALEKQIKTIQNEVKKYGGKLAKTPRLLVLTKVDAFVDEKKLAQWKAKLEKKAGPVFVISAVTGKGLKELLEAVWEKLTALWEAAKNQVPAPVEKVYESKERFRVEKGEGAFFVTGPEIEKWVAMTQFGTWDSLERFQKIIGRMGVVRELKKQGVKEGDVIYCADQEMVFSSGNVGFPRED